MKKFIKAKTKKIQGISIILKGKMRNSKSQQLKGVVRILQSKAMEALNDEKIF